MKRENPSKNFQKAKQKPMFSMLASEYFEVYARNNKRPKSYKDQRMLESSVWHGLPVAVDTNNPTYQGTLMGH